MAQLSCSGIPDPFPTRDGLLRASGLRQGCQWLDGATNEMQVLSSKWSEKAGGVVRGGTKAIE